MSLHPPLLLHSLAYFQPAFEMGCGPDGTECCHRLGPGTNVVLFTAQDAMDPFTRAHAAWDLCMTADAALVTPTGPAADVVATEGSDIRLGQRSAWYNKKGADHFIMTVRTLTHDAESIPGEHFTFSRSALVARFALLLHAAFLHNVQLISGVLGTGEPRLGVDAHALPLFRSVKRDECEVQPTTGCMQLCNVKHCIGMADGHMIGQPDYAPLVTKYARWIENKHSHWVAMWCFTAVEHPDEYEGLSFGHMPAL